jgi:hypothetical protein
LVPGSNIWRSQQLRRPQTVLKGERIAKPSLAIRLPPPAAQRPDGFLGFLEQIRLDGREFSKRA